MFNYMGPWEICLIQRTEYTDFAGPSNSIEENSFLQRFNIPSFQVLSAGILHQRQMTEPTMVGTGLSFVHSPLSLAGLFIKLRTPGTGLQNSVSREESNWVTKNWTIPFLHCQHEFTLNKSEFQRFINDWYLKYIAWKWLENEYWWKTRVQASSCAHLKFWLSSKSLSRNSENGMTGFRKWALTVMMHRPQKIVP